MGVDCKRLIAVGFGSAKPVADNSTPEGKAQNRRVSFFNAALRGRLIGGMPADGGGQIAGDLIEGGDGSRPADVGVVDALETQPGREGQCADVDPVLHVEGEGVGFGAAVFLRAGDTGSGASGATVGGLRVGVVPLEPVSEVAV